MNARRLFSVEKPGPLGITCPSISPAGAGTVPSVDQLDLRLAVPVGAEEQVQGAHRRTLDAGHQIHPLAAELVVRGLVVAGLDQVLRADERNHPVDHQDLAVVAQVGPALERRDRQHRAPLDAGRVQPGGELLVAGDALGPRWSKSRRTVTPRSTARTSAS